jgi:hypothetical protein
MSKVAAICLADRPQHLALFLRCLALQTLTDWHCLVLDQGDDPAVGWMCRNNFIPDEPYPNRYFSYSASTDRRVTHYIVPRHGDWGQVEKFAAAQRVDADWLCFPNDDAYYCPAFLERMVTTGEERGADLVYCDWVYDKAGYAGYQGRPITGQIDVGGFLVRREALLKHGWPDRGPEGDGHLIESLVKSGVPHAHVPGFLYVKN